VIRDWSKFRHGMRVGLLPWALFVAASGACSGGDDAEPDGTGMDRSGGRSEDVNDPDDGPGTGTSDSIPARLSHGEYVMTAEAVRRLGLQNLNALNYGARGFRDGGLVAPGSVPNGPGTLGGGTVNLGIGLQDGLVLDYIQSDAGGAVMISHIEKNRNAVRRVLGMR